MPLLPLAALLLVAAALLALAVARRLGAPLPGGGHAGLCLLGMAAALAALPLGPASLHPGPAPTFAVDGLSAVLVACCLLLAACDQPRPATTALIVVALLAADPVTLAVALAAALAIDRSGPASYRPLLRKGAALAALATALLLLGAPILPDLAFTAVRAAAADAPLGAARAVLLIPAVLAAAILLATSLPALPGAILAIGIVARLLLDLPGPTPPGWWGVPLLAVGMTAALLMARRAAAVADLREATAAAGATSFALAAAALGAALLARATDLLPGAALAVAAALLLSIAASLSTALLLRATAAIEAATGTSRLDQLGGLLSRAPLIGASTLVALASMAALPLTAGFAALWLLLQSLLLQAAPGTGRLGGTAILGLVAAALATAGLVQALLAAAAFRLAGTVLLGGPRTGQAALARHPRTIECAALATLAVAGVVAGLCPSLPVMLVQPATRLLAGAHAEGMGSWLLTPATGMPGYAAPAIAALLALAIAASARLGGASRAAIQRADPWRGGLAEDPPLPPGIMVPPPQLLWPDWRAHLRASRTALSAQNLLMALALVLAALLGWAAR